MRDSTARQLRLPLCESNPSSPSPVTAPFCTPRRDLSQSEARVGRESLRWKESKSQPMRAAPGSSRHLIAITRNMPGAYGISNGGLSGPRITLFSREQRMLRDVRSRWNLLGTEAAISGTAWTGFAFASRRNQNALDSVSAKAGCVSWDLLQPYCAYIPDACTGTRRIRSHALHVRLDSYLAPSPVRPVA